MSLHFIDSTNMIICNIIENVPTKKEKKKINEKVKGKIIKRYNMLE